MSQRILSDYEKYLRGSKKLVWKSSQPSVSWWGKVSTTLVISKVLQVHCSGLQKWNWTLECGEPFTKTSPTLPYLGISWFNEGLSSCYHAKASAHWTISCLGSSTVELVGWYTAFSHEVRVWSQASMNLAQEHALYEITPCGASPPYLRNLTSWTHHVLISWLMSQQKISSLESNTKKVTLV